jgi:glycosyltransferase involved in cell wall biosynthesis
MMHRLPSKAREAALRFARSRKEVFFSVLRAYREMKFAFRLLISPNVSSTLLAPVVPYLAPTPDTQAPIFKTADVYVSMGLDWDQKNLEYLYQLKQDCELRVVLFCYDIIPVRLPHLCAGDVAPGFAKYFTNAAWCADKILCISDWSRRDLEQFLREVGAPIPDLSVVHLGSEVPQGPGQLPSAEIADILQRRYVLFVSTIERRKNHETLYRAYSRLINGGATDLPLLVFVGMSGWGVNDLLSDLRLDPRIQPYIRMLNQVSDSDLSLLYEHCEFTVFPALYEGWGLPVAESLAYGKFCLASNAASIPEVGGNLIEYLDPWDIPAWTERLGRYFSHPEAVAEKEVKIRLEYRPNSWDETGAFVLAAAKQLAAS